MIRKVKLSDANEICRIYNFYINETFISFEEKEVSNKEMENRIRKVLENHKWIIFEKENKILGYAYSSKWKERDAYRFTAEITVYVDKNFTGKRIGKKLMKEIIRL